MENYKLINGYENYKIYDTGIVYSLKTKRKLKIFISKYGYEIVGLYKNGISKKHSIHRLVAENFLDKKHFKSAIVNHIDGNKKNNNVNNLEWCTHKQNTIHAFNIGLCKTGEKHHLSKISNKDVLIIKQLYKDKILNQPQLAKKFGIGQDQISRIINNKRRCRG